MFESGASKNFDELCDMQIRLANADCCLADRLISGEIFDAISKRIPIDMSNEHLDSTLKIVNKLRYLLLEEEAYDMIESSTLDFCGSLKKGWLAGYYMKTHRIDCIHYNECKASIYGPSHQFETSAIISGCHSYVSLIWAKERYKRLKNAYLIGKVVKQNFLVIDGHRQLDILKQSFGFVPKVEDNVQCNLDIVRQMFTPNQRPQLPDSDDVSKVTLPAPCGGDSFGRLALIKCMAAREKLKAKRPFIVCSSVWTDRIVWLVSLIRNLRMAFKAKIGLLCPNQHTVDAVQYQIDQYKKSKPIYVNTSRPNKLSSELDYLIIYQAHSIGVIETIESMTKIKPDGCVILIGDPKMPNLRIHSLRVREACGSILSWFYNRDRYPEYFEDGSPFIARTLSCFGYNPKIFDVFNRLFYDSSLVNIESLMPQFKGNALFTMKHVKGNATMYGCSPFNKAEVDACYQVANEWISEGVRLEQIGIMTTFCAQKKKISKRCDLINSSRKLFIGIPQDFENTVRDCLIISTVETDARTSEGKRYAYSDLLYDRLCLNLALTRGARRIIIIGDRDVLIEIDHWREFMQLLEAYPEPKVPPGSKTC